MADVCPKSLKETRKFKLVPEGPTALGKAKTVSEDISIGARLKHLDTTT